MVTQKLVKIGVVSDTHSLEIPKQLLNDLKKVDFIIHAGDFCDTADLEKFLKVNDVKAVYGNMDDMKIRKKFPRRQILKFGKLNIGLFHGEGAPKGILEVVKNEFRDDKVDAIVFGHSHQPFNETIGGILFFNPGSPNDSVLAPYYSYGILEVSENEIVGKIIKLGS